MTPHARTARFLLGPAWVMGLAAVAWALHDLGGEQLAAPPIGSLEQLRGWLDERDAIVVGFTALRLGALAATWYLLAVTGLGVVARLVRAPQLVRLTDRATVAPVRRLLAGVAGLGLTATVIAAAAPRPAEHHRLVLQRLPDGAAAVMERMPGQPPEPGDDGTATMRVLDDQAPPRRPSPPQTWTIRSGDHFWHVAQAVLVEHWKRPVDDREVSAYWRVLVEHNRSRLADPANPDLVYAGQVLELPAPPPAPAGAP